MSIKFYVGCDELNRPRPSRYQHEESGVLAICQALWDRLHSVDFPVAVIEGPRFAGSQPLTPDLILISKFGIGVVEMKNWSGLIPTEFAKKEDAPHLQVQKYAQVIVDQIKAQPDAVVIASRQEHPGFTPKAWLPDLPKTTKPMMIDTGACFTHIMADLHDYRKMAASRTHRVLDPNRLQDWERFQVLTPAEIPGWAWTLRFELHTGHDDLYNSYQISEETIDTLARLFFYARPIDEIKPLLQCVRQPHAYLRLINLPEHGVFRLDKEQHMIGRDIHTCDIVIPESFIRASNEHVRLMFKDGQYFLENVGRNGTYLMNEESISGLTRIHPGQSFLCGGKIPDQKVCQFMLVLDDQTKKPTEPKTQTEFDLPA